MIIEREGKQVSIMTLCERFLILLWKPILFINHPATVGFVFSFRGAAILRAFFLRFLFAFELPPSGYVQQSCGIQLPLMRSKITYTNAVVRTCKHSSPLGIPVHRFSYISSWEVLMGGVVKLTIIFTPGTGETAIGMR